MPTFEITGPDGKKYRVTGETADGAVSALQDHLDQPSTMEDLGRSALSGARSGVEGMVGMFGDVGAIQQSIAEWGLPKLGVSPETTEMVGKVARYATGFPGAPSTGQIQSITDEVVGEGYEPQTSAGGYARTLAQFLPAAALGPGRISQRLMYTAAPALMSETAGQATEGTDFEPYARLGGALAGVAGAPLLSTAARTFGGMAGVGNKGRSQNALAEVLARSGKNISDVTDDMARAAAEGQDMFTIADALGHSGHRMLSGVARQPGDMRQKIVNALDSRQVGQGRRVASFLDDAFGSQQGTALQKTAADKAARGASANVNYKAARDAAGAVDTTPAIQALDDIVQPGLSKMVGSGAADTGVLATLRRARMMLGKDKAQVSDFDRAFAAKIEWDKIISDNIGNPIAAKLIPARNALDDALSKASAPYANARNIYREQSRAIDAIAKGKLASTQTRLEDTLNDFGNMSDLEKSGFRTGYVDPLIRKTQKAAPGVNKARALVHDKAQVEFPAIAGEGRGNRMLRQLDRENTMFELRRQATGGSQTADNLADQIDVAAFDPQIITSLARGQLGPAITRAMEKASNVFRGRNSGTRDLMAQQLIQTDANAARELLTEAVKAGGKMTPVQQNAIRAVLSLLPTSRLIPAPQ